MPGIPGESEGRGSLNRKPLRPQGFYGAVRVDGYVSAVPGRGTPSRLHQQPEFTGSHSRAFSQVVDEAPARRGRPVSFVSGLTLEDHAGRGRRGRFAAWAECYRARRPISLERSRPPHPPLGPPRLHPQHVKKVHGFPPSPGPMAWRRRKRRLDLFAWDCWVKASDYERASSPMIGASRRCWTSSSSMRFEVCYAIGAGQAVPRFALAAHCVDSSSSPPAGARLRPPGGSGAPAPAGRRVGAPSLGRVVARLDARQGIHPPRQVLDPVAPLRFPLSAPPSRSSIAW